ncbi:unnamed protein product [Moneuplotes crassus]|uniref:non-specific serine/threonine protein kinase n=1 Tax=Euplotes crassus TaxID=5936 RepID=A0AAD1UEW4_EUPCR|nr:unnamed protein product [Moneuplotes crassus]
MAIIDGYCLIKDLGQGYFSRVKYARNLKNDRLSALKIMPRCRKYPNIREVYLNEIGLLQQVENDHIIKLHSYSSTKKSACAKISKPVPVYVVELEYCTHGELDQLLEATGRLCDKEARNYFKQLISAVECIHGLGYAHSDIKAQNLLLSEDYQLKLADFGFSTKEEILKDRIGTYSHMAPEIINKEPYDPKKGDLFACGVVLFHLVMGFLPFVAACPKDRSYNKIISRDFKGFWEIHEASHHSISNKFFSSFKDLFIKMVHPDVEERLTLEEIKEHEWFNACTIEGDELIASMKVRSKAALDSTELFPNEEFHFHNFIIPNDDIVPPKKSKKKGLQLKKYSEYFMSETGKTLLSAIISFAEAQGLCYTEDSTHSAVLLESQTDDENVSIKANVVDNPSCQSQCIECIKLSGEKTMFMKLFHQLCQYVTTSTPYKPELSSGLS